MSPEYDYEISRKVWDAHVPVEFILDTDSPDLPRPSYAMIPRCSYFCLSLPKILNLISARENGIKLDADSVWLECNGQALKMYYPVGVLFDLHKSLESQTWTVFVRTTARPAGVSSVSKDMMESMFMQAVKEADYIKRKAEVITSMKIEDHKQLWNGVMHNRFDEFWSVNKRLMETSDSSPFLNIPIRLYTLSQNFRQIPQPPTNENGQLRTVEDALSILAPDLLLHGRYRFISHGISIPNETPLVYLARNFSYPDNFVHICAVLK